MLTRLTWPERYSANLREAEAIATSLTASIDAIDDTVARTGEIIAESRRLIDQIDKQLAR